MHYFIVNRRSAAVVTTTVFMYGTALASVKMQRQQDRSASKNAYLE